MRVFFVVDIKDGLVVAAKRGERESYKPIESPIVPSSDPISVINAVKPKYLYAADLDRITGVGDNGKVLEKLSGLVSEMIADCGFKNDEELKNLPFVPVVGTETFDITRLKTRCYVSLDFKGKFLDASKKFKSWREAVEVLNSYDLYGIIVLPIHSVGTMKPEFELVEEVIAVSDHPVMLGGGISGVEDLSRAKEIGCSGVLVATAVHKGKIPLDVVRRGEF